MSDDYDLCYLENSKHSVAWHCSSGAAEAHNTPTRTSLFNSFSKACAPATGQMALPGLGAVLPLSRFTHHLYTHPIRYSLPEVS